MLVAMTVGARGAEPLSNPKIKVLIVDGFSNHDWRKTTAFIKATLSETDSFEVDVSTSPGQADDGAWEQWRPTFSDYDVVIQNSNNIGQKDVRWPRAVEHELENYVRGGGGLLIYHSANNAFDHWPEYDRMIGLGWRDKDHGPALQLDAEGAVRRIPAGQGEGTSHGPRQDTVVTRLTDHPINRGTPQRWLTPDIEVYTFARGPAEQLTVLSYGRHHATDTYWPLEWVVAYGDGRVYNSSFGHIWNTDEGIPERVRCVGFQTALIRAAEWLANGEVSWPTPDDYPSEDAIRLRTSPAGN
jgi:type 1 glutamine amidotransferase